MTDKLASAYLIVGDDPYLTSEALGEILAGVSPLAISEFAPASDPAEIIQALDTPSIFGDRRAVVVRDIDETGTDLQRRLLAYLERPGESVSLIILSHRPVPSFRAAIRKVGRIVETARGKRADLFGWLREEAKAKGLRVTGDTMNALLEALGEERMALAQALDELALAFPEGERLSADQVHRHFRGRADARVFGFVDAVAGRQPGPALEALHGLLRQGETPQALFWTLVRHFRMLLLAADISASDAASKLGIQAWRAEKLVRQSRNFSAPELIGAYRLLADADRRMKKSEEPEEFALERAAVTIATR